MKNVLAIMMMAFALMFVSSQTEAVTQEDWDAVVVNNIDFLALRSGPSTNYSTIVRIPPGARVRVTLIEGWSYANDGWRDYDEGFFRVEYRGNRGFAHGRYITLLRRL